MKVYVLHSIVGGVSQGVEVYATAKSARAAFLKMAREWASCDTITDGQGAPTSARDAAAEGYFGAGDGDDDAYLVVCEVAP